MPDTESLREALLDAERALARERGLRHQGDALLAGFAALARASTVDELLAGLFDELRKWFSFEHGALLEVDAAKRPVTSAATIPTLKGLVFDPLLLGGASARTRALVDATLAPEWEHQTSAARALARSVLYVPVGGESKGTILLCTHSEPRFFTPRHIALGERLAPLLSPALTKLAFARSIADFREFIDRSPEAIFVRRGTEIVYVNEALVSLLGYARADLLGRDPLAFVQPEDRETILANRALHPQPRVTKEFRWVCANGTTVTVEAVGANVVFEGEPARIVQARDVTERNRLQAKLALSDRLASVGTLAAGVAHELNNPLANVVANMAVVAEELEQLASEGGDRTRLNELTLALDDARAGADRMRKIVRGLRDFSGNDPEANVAVDLPRMLDTAASLTANQLRHYARVVKQYGATPSLVANEAKLVQVFVNLLTNAAHAIGAGHAPEHTITLRTLTDASGWGVAEVADTGRGIPESVLARIFDPFFTTKPVGDGMGIGLSICHGIVSSCGGEITVQSTVGHGTTFRVRLPPAAAVARTASIRPLALAPSKPSLPQRRVLIIDDDPLVAKAIARTLRKHHVEVVTDAREALNRLRAGEEYDVVLCDLMMPDMDGMQFYEQIAELLPSVLDRIVFVTGGAFTQAATDFLDRIPNIRLQKPFDPRRLQEIVGDMLV